MSSFDHVKRFADLPDEGMVRLPVVCALLSCSPRTIRRLTQAGKLIPRHPTPRITAYRVGDVRLLLKGEAK